MLQVTVTPQQPDNWWSNDPVSASAAPSSREPRGIRNNNPLNIEAGSFTASQPGYQGSDGRFAKFETPDHGVAAAEKLIDTYATKHGINTVAGIVNRWAPAADGNNVMAYADSVARDVGVNPNQPLDLADAQLKRGIVMAMGKFENGRAIAPAAKVGADWWNSDPVADQSPKAGPIGERFPTSDALTQQKYATDQGALNAGARGVANGLTLNFFDELMGLAAASGLNPKDPSDLLGLLHGAYKYLSNDPEAVRRYNETVARERGLTKQAEEQHPVASTVGNVAGTLAVPIPGATIARGATFAGRAANAAATGAGIGALAGVGEGEGAADSAAKGLVGGAVGGAIGGAAVPVIEGGARLIGSAVSKPVNIVRAAINPEGAAERAVGRAYRDAQRIDPAATNRLTQAELNVSGPATVMDTLGAGGRDLARSAANSSGEARDILNRTLDPRFEEQGARLTNWLRSTFNYPDVHAQQAAIEQAAKQVNKGTYARAMNAPEARSMWDEGFQQIVQAPVVQEAMKGATRTAANRATLEGFTPVKNPFVFGADGRLTMKEGMTPNLAYWDAVKRNLDDKIGSLQRAGEKSAAADAIQLKNALVDHLDELVPAYQKARAGAAAFFKANDALEAGQNYVAENFSKGETLAALGKMQPHERKLFQDGFVSRFIETIDKVPDRADVVRKIYNSPAAKEKIEIALGPQRARELETMLRVENIMQQSLRSVQGNSTTVQQLVGLGLAGAAGGGVLGYDPTASGLATALATVTKKGVDRRVAEQVAKLLTSSDPAALQRGIQMVARNQRLLSVLRAADNGAARVGGQQAPNSFLPAIQAPVAGRADDNQPAVPRPPGQ